MFSLYADEIVDDAGSVIAPNYLVVSPKGRDENGITGIAVVPLVDHQVGLVRVHRHAVGVAGWELPRGFVDVGECVEDAALRELQEETGLSGERTHVRCTGTIMPDPGVLDARIRCVLIRHCTVTPHNESEFGHTDFQLFSFQDVDRLIREGEMVDAVSLAAWHRCMCVA